MELCAIAGAIDIPVDQEGIQSMLKTMARRGPDGQAYLQEEGCLFLHTRLAIIDPEHGQQPMQLCWNREEYTLIYNGELYNAQELRRELTGLGHLFQTSCDTEVILHAYAAWGQECLERFNGIFAFAVWEKNARRLFLARDRIGVKPLFYAQQGQGILFASEIKTLLVCPGMKAQLDSQGIFQILMLGPGRVQGSGVFRNIYEIKPGWCAEFSNGTLQKRCYWRLQDRPFTDSFEDAAEKVRYFVTDSIRRQMVSDVPVGCFLSGGLDSSIITAVAAEYETEHNRRLQTFSVDYPGNAKYFRSEKFQPSSDNAYIAQMEKAVPMVHDWTLLSPQTLVDALEDAVIARDLPGMADVDASLLAFCRRIRPKVKVALSGECADEIFGGYPWYRDPDIRQQAGFPWAQNTRQRAQLLHRHGPEAEDYVMSLYEESCKQCDILPGTGEEDRRIKEMVNLNFQWFMQTLLDRKDRMSMYWGLEVRVPFCDYRIAEYLYTVPWAWKNHCGQEKGLLRYAMRGIIPEEIRQRKKSPYPKTLDPEYERLLAQKIEHLYESPRMLWELIDPDALRSSLHEGSPWPWYGQLMRRPQLMAYILQIDFWLEHYKVQLI